MIKETRLLFEALTQGSSAEEIVSMAQKELFNNPVLITNSFFRVIAMSSDIDFFDPVWENAKLYGRMSKEHNEVFSTDPASVRLFEQGSPFLYDTGLGAEIPRILGKIQIKNKTMGYIVIFQVNNPLTERDVKVSDLVCQALSVILTSTDNISFLSQSRTEYFLRELLEETGDNAYRIESEITQLHWVMKPRFRVVYAKFTEEKKKNVEYIPYILEMLNQISPQYLYAFEHQYNIFILYNYETTMEMRNYEQKISFLGEKYHLCMGQSRSFSKINALRSYYEQAKQACEIGIIIDPQEMFYRFSKYSYYSLIKKCNLEELKCIQCKEYRTLRQYDQIHETPFLETVVMFFLNNTNINATAEKIHIHRNTLNYRLNRVKEILKIETWDIALLMSIYHSGLIEEWIEKCYKI